MTYTKPELLLVGAAQNLVLFQCNYESDLGTSCIREVNPQIYDHVETW
jgi:hypothetical protein